MTANSDAGAPDRNGPGGAGPPEALRAPNGNISSSFQYAESPASRLLSRLDKVREFAPVRWYACCPSHEDKSPSLTITHTSDGRVLIYCMVGCDASEIVAAVGLGLRDLFEKPRTHHATSIPIRARFNPWDLLPLLRHEADVLVIASAMLARREALDDIDRRRVLQANPRIGRAVGAIRGCA